jgi:hypothetical protein
MADNTAAKIKINFAESMVDGKTYDGPREPQGFRTMAKDGYYRVAIEEATPGQSEAGNAVLNLVVRVLDKDEEGTRVYGTVTCSGHTSEDTPRPNIWNLLNLLLSAGRTKEQLDSLAQGGKQMELGDIATSLIQDGKNVAYAQIKHEISKQGNFAGREVSRVKTFVLQSTYEKKFNEQGLDGIRWAKKLDGVAKTAGSQNGVHTTAKMSTQQLDAAAKGI